MKKRIISFLAFFFFSFALFAQNYGQSVQHAKKQIGGTCISFKETSYTQGISTAKITKYQFCKSGQFSFDEEFYMSGDYGSNESNKYGSGYWSVSSHEGRLYLNLKWSNGNTTYFGLKMYSDGTLSIRGINNLNFCGYINC